MRDAKRSRGGGTIHGKPKVINVEPNTGHLTAEIDEAIYLL